MSCESRAIRGDREEPLSAMIKTSAGESLAEVSKTAIENARIDVFLRGSSLKK
jgi:hypothetical protein